MKYIILSIRGGTTHLFFASFLRQNNGVRYAQRRTQPSSLKMSGSFSWLEILRRLEKIERPTVDGGTVGHYLFVMVL